MEALTNARAIELSPYAGWVGSLRRNRAEVGDVELLFIPKRGTVPDQGDLFGNLIEKDMAEEVIAGLLANGVLKKRPGVDGTHTWGPKNKLAVHVKSGIPVDLFTATLENWSNLLFCRTGPASLNAIVARRAQDAGLHWNPYGAGFYRGEELAIPVRSEKDVFNAVGLDYVDPIYRDGLAASLNTSRA